MTCNMMLRCIDAHILFTFWIIKSILESHFQETYYSYLQQRKCHKKDAKFDIYQLLMLVGNERVGYVQKIG